MVKLNLIKSCEENQNQKFSTMPIVKQKSWSDENNLYVNLQSKINLFIKKIIEKCN